MNKQEFLEALKVINEAYPIDEENDMVNIVDHDVVVMSAKTVNGKLVRVEYRVSVPQKDGDRWSKKYGPL